MNLLLRVFPFASELFDKRLKNQVLRGTLTDRAIRSVSMSFTIARGTRIVTAATSSSSFRDPFFMVRAYAVLRRKPSE